MHNNIFESSKNLLKHNNIDTEVFQLARANDAHSMMFIGDSLLRVKNNRHASHLAFQWYKLAYENGNANAGLKMAKMLVEGHGTPQDKTSGFKYLHILARLKDAEAYFYLAHYSFVGLLERHPQKISKYLRKAIKLGYEEAFDLKKQFEALKQKKDYFFGKDYEEFKHRWLKALDLHEDILIDLVSRTKASVYESHLKKAIDGNVSSMQALHDSHTLSSFGRSYWFERYLEHHPLKQRVLSENNVIPSQDNDVKQLNAMFKLSSHDREYLESAVVFPSFLPTPLKRHINEHIGHYLKIAERAKKGFLNRAPLQTTVIYSRSFIRMVLVQLTHHLNLNELHVNDQKLSLLKDLFKHILLTIHTYFGDFKITDTIRKPLVRAVCYGCFDHIPALQQTVHDYVHAFDNYHSVLESYPSLDLVLETPYIAWPYFSHLNAWIAEAETDLLIQKSVLSLMALETVLFQSALTVSRTLEEKASIHWHYFNHSKALIERYFGLFKNADVKERVRMLWVDASHEDYRNNLALEKLFENYETPMRFDDYFRKYAEAWDFDEDEDVDSADEHDAIDHINGKIKKIS